VHIALEVREPLKLIGDAPTIIVSGCTPRFEIVVSFPFQKLAGS
jgi:hypothetical protein